MRTKENPLIKARNRKLIERYLYWTEIERRRTDDVFRILEWEEFFIGQQSIMLIIRNNPQIVEEELARLKEKYARRLKKNSELGAK
ncbi:MAG: transposase [Bacteroidales bacterium]|nr:transposase [Bacteroidales bacterium]